MQAVEKAHQVIRMPLSLVEVSDLWLGKGFRKGSLLERVDMVSSEE
jgi:hypothetical protein